MARWLVMLAVLIALTTIPTRAIMADDNPSILLSPANAAPPPITPQIANKISATVGRIKAYQAQARANGGRYWQALNSHGGAIPADGQAIYPAGWFARPSDRGPAWDAAQVLDFEPLPYSVTVDEYISPFGAGWVACFDVRSSGRRWQMCQGDGPESQRQYDWREVAP